jgi:hypothetical protein
MKTRGKLTYQGALLLSVADALSKTEPSNAGSFIPLPPQVLAALAKECLRVVKKEVAERKTVGRKSKAHEWKLVAHHYYLVRVQGRAAGTQVTPSAAHEAVKILHPWITDVEPETFDRYMREHRDWALDGTVGTIYLAEHVPEEAIAQVRDEDLTKHARMRPTSQN